ncbi:MAG: hypothetical protein JST92_19220 [Deltaproteobacteria bacterium]|nr:hypothetical protein [Deltaproteobacteria bacterium]
MRPAPYHASGKSSAAQLRQNFAAGVHCVQAAQRCSARTTPPQWLQSWPGVHSGGWTRAQTSHSTLRIVTGKPLVGG